KYFLSTTQTHCLYSNLLFFTLPPPPTSTLFPYTTLFRSLPEIKTDVAEKIPRDDLDLKDLKRNLHFAVSKIFRKLTDCLIAKFEDRKSTRLNSSHVKISYAVFCLKKKKKR